MTLDEALGDLSIQLEVKRRLGADHQANAIKLGIEALKAIQKLRLGTPNLNLSTLLGETKD